MDLSFFSQVASRLADYIGDKQWQYDISSADLQVDTHNIIAFETKLAHIRHHGVTREDRANATTWGEFKRMLKVQVGEVDIFYVTVPGPQ